MGVKLDYDALERLSSELKSIVEEFDKAGSRRNSLEDAVARPYGESALHDAADDFEGRWDDRRKRLKGNCQELAEHVDDVLKGFKDFDEKAGSKTGER